MDVIYFWRSICLYPILKPYWETGQSKQQSSQQFWRWLQKLAWGRLIHERDLFSIEWRQQIKAFWLAINVHNFKELPKQGLIVFINNWSKQFQFGVVKMQVRVNGLPDWEIHESRQTTQLFSANYWGGFHAELFQIKVDSSSGIKHNMVISNKSGRRSFHLRREFLKVHTGDTSKYW